MAIIDTLKLARALHERGGLTQEAAAATAEALNEAFVEGAATKTDIDRLDGTIKGEVDRLDGTIKAEVTRLDSTIKTEVNRLEGKIKAEVNRLEGKIAVIDGKLMMLIWAVGINVAATITMLVKHW